MQTFPIFKLPLLAGINVIDHLDVEDIFVFSLASVRAKHLAIAARKRIDGLGWDFSLEKDDRYEYDICLTRGFCLRMPVTDEAKETGKLVEWKLNGQLIPMYRTDSTWYIGYKDENLFELHELLSKQVLEVFQCQEFEFQTTTSNFPVDLLVKYTRQFEAVSCLDEGLLPEHLKVILEQLEIRDLLEVEPKLPGFHWSGPLRMERLYAYDASWLTFEALMNNECKELCIKHHTFTSAQLNTFLKKWLYGGFPNLEFCIFRAETNAADVLEGIETMPYNPTNRPDGHPCFEEVDLSVGRDIRRNDGVYATVVVNERQLAMGVWLDYV